MNAEELSERGAIQDRHTGKIMSIEGVNGFGINHDGFTVYLEYRCKAQSAIPREIEGYPVTVKLIGRIELQ